MLIGTASRFEPGQQLSLRFRLRIDQPNDLEVRATVRHVTFDPSRDRFPRLMGIEFEREMPSLEKELTS